ncbi:ATP-binding cassette domain-containing protein [Oligoflexia bacterium]|nr:ATP-binding cassette domain-containing protein [Oligoflexia bacterium]
MTEQALQALELTNVSKAFNGHQVLKALSLTVHYGDFALLLGANGSGKSTLMRICTQLARPDQGSVSLEGRSDGFFSIRDG